MRYLASCSIFLAVLAGSSVQAAPQSPAAAESMRQACGTDYKRLCADVKPGGGRILACLRSHAAELSIECRQILPTQRRSTSSDGQAAAPR